MKITFIKTGKRVKPKEKRKKESKNIVENVETKTKKTNFFKSELFNAVFRKNQIVLLTLALMLVTAGYMNYNNKNEVSLAEIGDAKLVSANVTSTSTNSNEENATNEESVTDEASATNEENATDEASAINEENVTNKENVTEDKVEETSKTVESKEETVQNYFEQTRLERQTMYSQMLDAYKKILENEKIPSDQKSIASNEIKNINDKINAIAIIENLIKTKDLRM